MGGITYRNDPLFGTRLLLLAAGTTGTVNINGGTGYVVENPGTATVVIIDDDGP